MNESEARQRLADVNGTLDDALLDARRELREAERRLSDAVRATQRHLDGIAVPEQFDVRAFASGSVGVLEAYAEFRAAQARRQQLDALAKQLA